MTTKREQIMQAIVATLGTATDVAGNVYRSREEALTRADVPALIVTADGEEPLQDVSGFMEKQLTVAVGVFVRGDVPDTLADPIVESVHALLMGEPTLGGLALDMSEGGTTWDMDEADQTALIVNMRFVVWYRHARANLAG